MGGGESKVEREAREQREMREQLEARERVEAIWRRREEPRKCHMYDLEAVEVTLSLVFGGGDASGTSPDLLEVIERLNLRPGTFNRNSVREIISRILETESPCYFGIDLERWQEILRVTKLLKLKEDRITKVGRDIVICFGEYGSIEASRGYIHKLEQDLRALVAGHERVLKERQRRIDVARRVAALRAREAAPTAPPAEPEPSASECPICLEPMTSSNSTATVCGHVFHAVCIGRSIATNPDCPICRTHLGKTPVLSSRAPP
jgi:hypothetical protein